jgi:hypothetical protein
MITTIILKGEKVTYLGDNYNCYDGLTVLIRNMEASLLYYLGTEQNKNHKGTIKKYESLCSKKNALKCQIKTIKDDIDNGKAKASDLIGASSELSESEDKIKELGKQIFKIDKSFGCKLKGEKNRYYYKGNLADSLMRRELIRQIEKKNNNCDRFILNDDINPTMAFADIILNISFKTDFMVKDSAAKNGKSYRKIICTKKLRDIFYRDGIWINGIHYVEFQRSSSKARTGDCLFIKEQYLSVMQSWQRLGLNFRKEITRNNGQAYKKPKYIEIDVTGARSYESLTSSSIIGEVNINP